MAMKKIIRPKTIIISLVVLFLFIQVFRINKNNPVSDEQSDFLKIENAPEDISLLLKRGCYDCHSNETVYPWYSNIAPVSWILNSHITEGREHVNFSEWGNYQPGRRGHKRDACAEMIQKGYMPLKPYTVIHKDAKFTSEEKEKLVKWLTVE